MVNSGSRFDRRKYYKNMKRLKSKILSQQKIKLHEKELIKNIEETIKEFIFSKSAVTSS